MTGQSKMAHPALEDYPPEHLLYKESLEGNGLILHIGAHYVGVSLYQRPTGSILSLRTDSPTVGGTKPEDAPLLDKYNIPFVVALISDGLFLWGNEARTYHEIMQQEHVNFKKTIRYWNLGSLLMSGTSPSEPEEVEFADGHSCKVTLDLLLAIFFRHLVNWVQNDSEKDHRQEGLVTLTDDVIFCVPFWFPSLSRMRLQNAAAIIALTTVSIVNEGTLAAFIMDQMSSRLPSTGISKDHHRQFLVFAENGGNVDLTYHLATGDKMKMVAFAGNMYPFTIKDMMKLLEDNDSVNLDCFTIHPEYKTRYNENRFSVSHKVELIQGLIYEVYYKIPKNLRANFGRKMEMVTVVESEFWENLFLTKFATMFRIATKLAQGPSLVDPRGGPRVMFWQELNYTPIMEKLFTGCFIEDLNPFELFGKHSLQGNLKWQGDDNQKFLTIEPAESGKVELYEEYGTLPGAQKLTVGTLKLPPLNNEAYVKLTIKMRRSKLDGAYFFEGIYGTDATGDESVALRDHQYRGKLLPARTFIMLEDVVDIACDYGEMYKAKLTALRMKWKIVKLQIDQLMLPGAGKKSIKIMKEIKNELVKMDEIDNLLQTQYFCLPCEQLDEFMKDLVRFAAKLKKLNKQRA